MSAMSPAICTTMADPRMDGCDARQGSGADGGIDVLSPPARRWAWGLLAAFAVQDGEEAFVIVRDGGMQALGRWETVPQALSGIMLEASLIWALVFLATTRSRSTWAVRAFTAVLIGWTLHGVGHLAAGALGEGYAFGVVMALPCCLVYGGLALRKVLPELRLSAEVASC